MDSPEMSARIISRQYQDSAESSHCSSTSRTKPVAVVSNLERGTVEGPGWPAFRSAVTSSMPCACRRHCGMEVTEHVCGEGSLRRDACLHEGDELVSQVPRNGLGLDERLVFPGVRHGDLLCRCCRHQEGVRLRGHNVTQPRSLRNIGEERPVPAIRT